MAIRPIDSPSPFQQNSHVGILTFEVSSRNEKVLVFVGVKVTSPKIFRKTKRTFD